MAQHDESYRLLFSNPRMVEDLLRGFVREPWVEELDFSTLAPVPAALVSGRLRRREADVLWRVTWRGQPRRRLYVYLLLEFQSTEDRWMALRMLGYLALLYQDLIRRGELTPEGLLPPVLPVVLYNGRRPWQAARDVAELIASGPAELRAYCPRLRHALLDEARLPGAPLGERLNLAAALFRLERARRPEEMWDEVAGLADRLADTKDRELRRAFAAWLGQALGPARLAKAGAAQALDLSEVTAMLRETVIEWTKEWLEEGKQVGREEGKQLGRTAGEAAILLRLLERRFGPLPEAARKQVESADADQLLLWADRVLSAGRLEDVFAG